MTDPKSFAVLPPAVRRALDAVRRRIRAYVLVEGVAIVVAVLGVIFWLGLAVDRYFEPTAASRRIAIIFAACIFVYVCYQYLLRRLIVALPDATLAVLLERRFPALKDHVLTAVDVAAQSEWAHNYHPELIARTNQDAAASVSEVNASDLFDLRPVLSALRLGSCSSVPS
jgi:hypothetical protein